MSGALLHPSDRVDIAEPLDCLSLAPWIFIHRVFLIIGQTGCLMHLLCCWYERWLDGPGTRSDPALWRDRTDSVGAAEERRCRVFRLKWWHLRHVVAFSLSYCLSTMSGAIFHPSDRVDIAEPLDCLMFSPWILFIRVDRMIGQTGGLWQQKSIYTAPLEADASLSTVWFPDLALYRPFEIPIPSWIFLVKTIRLLPVPIYNMKWITGL